MIRFGFWCLALILPASVFGAALLQVEFREEELRSIAAELPELRRRASDADLATDAVIALTGILRRLEPAEVGDSAFGELEAELSGRALEYRARAYLSRGDREEGIQDARTLLLLAPGWEVDRSDLTPAFVDMFEQERVRLVAWIQVETTPPGATVFIGDSRAGETPLVGYPVVSGSMRIRVERAGYRGVEFPRMDVLAGEVVRLEQELLREGPVLPIITAPPGVTVRVDGRVAGTTGGSLPEDLKPMAPPRFAEEDLSAPLDIGGLRVGAQEITLSAPCRQQSRFTFHADEARDYLPRFVRLRPSIGALLVESEPPGGRVLLDGEEQGVTPLTFSALCAGRHQVEIRHPAGRCRETVEVRRDARASVVCRTKPLLRLAPAGPDAISPLEEVARRAVAAAEVGYLLPPEDPGEGSIVSELRVVPGASGGRGVVELTASGASLPDGVPFDRFDPDSVSFAVERILRPVPRRAAWAGFSAGLRRVQELDGSSSLALEVFSVHPEGPAVLAGMEPGDLLLEVDGRPVADEAILARILAEQIPDQPLDVLVRRGDSDRLLRITIATVPILPTASAHRCNRRLVEILADAATGGEDAVRRLEAGICRFLLGDPGAALAEGLGAPADAGMGALKGARLYYRGLALFELGDREEAIRSLEAAAAVPGAYLISPSGPPLGPLVRRLLRRLR